MLVNLDIPWNPAILDQRVARIHRLGQQNKVQVLHLVAPESYEEQVLKLIQGKRKLFDNVVNPDTTEDVVGVSKRLAEVLAEDLAATTAEDTAEALPAPAPQLPDETDATPAPAEPATAIASGRLAAPDPTDPGVAEEVRRCILALQRELGPGIERILGAQGSLLVVMDAVDDAADERAAAVSQQIPIALIDRRTLKSLQRLGAASPANDAKSLYEAPEQSAATQPALTHRARQKLEAAEILLGQDHPAPAGELLLGTLLCAATLRCGDTAPPEPRTAGVWLYANALPSGKLQPDDATLIMRAVALAQAEDQAPPDLLAALVADVARFITDTTDCA